MSKVPISPLADYVVAVQEEAKARTASGLYLPESGSEKPKIAKVLATGTAVANVKSGDRIIFGGFSNTEVKVDGATYLLIQNKDIYAKIA